jgi:LmbE family N-acetylglucosaminyl deacetylase
MTRSLAALPALALLLWSVPAQAQLAPLPHEEGAVGLGLALRRLPTAASVLYVTAHPDDENNGVLVQLARGRGYETALLTVTRGDGGQNEIGPELFQALGILRTEELAGIHRYDGVTQYFTRAYEFGYSFSVEETFEKWGREEILGDVVKVIRTVRPDVILTLPLEGAGGGQHHQAAARLAVEAFRAAADPARFPEQVAAGLPAWQVRKIYRGGVGGGNEIPKDLPIVTVDTSAYDPLLGQSAFQFGILARANHKCQGMTQMRAPPGTGAARLALVDSEPKVTGPETDILDGLDTSVAGLARFAGASREAIAPGLRAIADAARQAQEAYDARVPEKTTSALRAGLTAVRALVAGPVAGLDGAARYELAQRLAGKERQFEQALALAHGLTLEASAADGDVVRGQSFAVRVRAFNQGAEPVRLDEVALAAPPGWTVTRQGTAPAALAARSGAELAFTVTVAPDARYSQPYWRRDPKVDRYAIDIPAHHTLPWSPPDLMAGMRYVSGDVQAGLSAPAWWRYEGPWVGGEKQKVVNVVPVLSVAVTPDIAVVPVGAATRREFRVQVRHLGQTPTDAVARLTVPAGWTVEPRQAPLRFRFEGEESAARFFVTAPASVRAGTFGVGAEVDQGGTTYREGYQVIAYDHIQERHLFHPATAQIQAIPVTTTPGVSIGYVEGAGDEVAEAIEQLGLKVTPLGPDDLAWGDLSRFSTIVTGIRAYQTRPDLRANNHRLLDYARAGGHVVVQYNKFEFNGQGNVFPGVDFGRPTGPIVSPYAPYPAAVTANRITEENAPVKVLQPQHPVLRGPNAIGPSDFEGWVQERGLYFLEARDPQYVELLAATDPFEKNAGEKKGMLVDAPLGRGSWTYVGLGLWRQLPAGTPGAYRLLANLLSRPRAR